MAQRSTLTDLEAAHLPAVVDEHQWKSEKTCIVCGKTFGAFTKKYHCKFCFHAVCSHCSPGTLPSAKYGKPRRACDLCLRAQSGDSDLAIKEAEIEQLRKMLEEKEELILKEVNEKSELWEKLAQASQTIVRLKEELKNREGPVAPDEKHEKRREKVKRLKAELATSQSEQNRLQAELASLRGELSAQTSEAKTQHEALASKLEKRRAKKAALKEQIEAEKQHKSELAKHKESLESEFSGLKSQLEAHQLDKQALLDQFSALQQQLLTYKADVETQGTAFAAEKEKVSDLEKEVEEKEREIAGYLQKVAKHKEKIHSLKTRLSAAEAAKESLISSMSLSSESAVTEHLKTISQLTAEKSACERELDDCKDELSTANSRIQSLEDASGGLTEQLSSLKAFDKSRSEQMIELKQENARLKSELLAVKTQNGSDDLTVIQREIAAKDVQIRNLEAKLQDMERLTLAQPRDHQPCLKCSLF